MGQQTTSRAEEATAIQTAALNEGRAGSSSPRGSWYSPIWLFRQPAGSKEQRLHTSGSAAKVLAVIASAQLGGDDMRLVALWQCS